MRETLIDNEFASLWYYPDTKIIHHQFKKFIYGPAFREVIMKGLEYFENEGCEKWLSDDRGNSALHPDDKEWGDTNWTPRVIAAGWKYWALILPEKVIGQMNMRRLIQEYLERGVEVEVFSNPEEGLAWLESK